ncbi:helix-turn-helix transcriptional regulator [Actinophytocola sp.]|uniref:helix-turn-helix transcriptional regulator n=1 Tax=Actinophytocola sp. TaxID=1872138 RepID=UPI002ED93FF5
MARRVSVPELVGRRAELAVLDSLLPGDTRLVLVDGDAGVGKTRLVQAFAARVADRATVLTGGCLQFEADLPYAPFAEALPQLFAEPATGDRAAAYRRVADAITRAGDQVLLVIEDLHWADASTRDLLRHLHRALADAPVLVVATCRADELTADHPVATLVAELARSPRTERLHLAPLDRPGVAALARAVLGTEPPQDLVDALVARAEGNPFFTEELLAAWPGTGDVPRTVREIVLTRLARLSPDAQRVARLASVAGRTVPHDLLAGLDALPGTDLGPALRELVDHGQLTTTGPDSYAFRHALIHESLYRDLLPGERRAAHARIAAHLAEHPELGARSAAGAAAELAHHWDAAGDAARALAASVEAAAAAVDGLAPAEAHAHYERALRRWHEVAEHPAGLTHDVLLERAAEAASLAGHNQRAVELTKARIAELVEEAGAEHVALAYEQLSYQARSAGNWALARTASRQSVRLVPADSPARLRIESWLMMLDMLASRHLDAVRRAGSLLPNDDPMATNRALTALGTGHVMLGHVDEGVEHLRRHREFADRSGIPRFIGVGYVNTSESLIWADRQTDALAMARQGVERATEYGFDIYLLPIVGNVVRALAELHRWDEATDPTQDPDDPAADPFNWVFVDLPRADILLRRGDLAGAAVLLKRSGTVLDGQEDVQYGTELATLRARLAAAEHRWDDARTAVRAGLAVALGAQEMWLATRLVATGVQVEADAVADDPAAGAATGAAAADELLAAGRRHRAELEAAGAAALPRTLRAQALADASRTRLGTPDPDAWVALAGLAGVDRHLAGYARFREAEALLQVKGSRARAAEALADAAATAADLGAAPLAELTAALAGRARLTPRSAPPAHGLTARETEILTLVGRGLTNAEIAAELFISTKTASVHVSNILRKLGLRSRIHAAAFAHRREQA